MGLQRQIGRATGLLFAGALSVTLLTGGALRAWADDDLAPGQKANAQRNFKLDVCLMDMPLSTAVRLVEQQLKGVSIVLHDSKSPTYGTVTLSLKAQPVDDVLKLIAVAANADFWQEDGIYHIGPRGTAPKPAPDLGSLLPNPMGASVSSVVPSRVEKIMVRFTDAYLILHQLGVYGSEKYMGMDVRMNPYVMQSMLSLEQTTPKPLGGYGIQTVPGSVVPVAAPTGNAPATQNSTLPSAQDLLPGNSRGSAPDTGAHRSGEDEEFHRGGQFQPPGGGGFGQQGQGG